MKIVITGGHFSPAYSVILKLKSEHDVIVVGRRYAFENDTNETFENKVCKKLGIKFINLKTGRLQRNFSLSSIRSLTKFPFGIYNAIKILKEERPDVCVTFGGYIGLPVAIASKILGIPVVLHEQTQKAGLSAKLISKFSSVVLISFESSKKYFQNNKVIVTGNPLRPEYFSAKKVIDVKSPSIYVTGGSTGSHFINQAIEIILPYLLKKYYVYHQTGNAKEFNDYERLKKMENSKYTVKDFYNPSEVFDLLRSVDLVISRSGANTVNEILASESVSLLIPLPIGQTNEQLDNAEYIKDLGCGEYLLQKDVDNETLIKLIDDMIENKKHYKNNLKKAKDKVKLDSIELIIEQILHYGREKSNRKKRAEG